MSGIFPPADKGGRPPGGNVCNGFSPTHPTIGEGPLYIAADCTTFLTDCQMNSIVSEMVALVDRLGLPWNADRVDNMATAVGPAIGTGPDITGKVDRAGDTMTGPFFLFRDPQQLLEAATKQYVDNENTTQGNTLRAYTDQEVAAARLFLSTLIAQVDAAKINRAGDTMTGTLVLAHDPVALMDAATKAYVDAIVASVAGLADAPHTGQTFGRNNGFWVQIAGGGGGITDAPSDGLFYGRR